MKKLITILLVSLLLVPIVPQDSYAGPWTLKQNKLWMEVYTRYFFSKNYFDAKGKKHRWEDGGFSEIWDLEVKFEYGATDKLNLLLGIPYSWSSWRNDWSRTMWSQKFKHEGFKEINFGAKYKFMEKPVTAAAQIKAFIHPQNTDQAAQPDLFEYGDGLEVRGLIGKSFNIWKRPAYVSFESGYRFESNWVNKSDFANYIPVFGEAGFSPHDRLMVKGEIDFRYSDQGTGIRKDTLTYRVGTIISILGRNFSSIKKGGDSSLNLELQFGQTVWGRGDGSSERFNRVSQAYEYIFKIQALF